MQHYIFSWVVEVGKSKTLPSQLLGEHRFLNRVLLLKDPNQWCILSIVFSYQPVWWTWYVVDPARLVYLVRSWPNTFFCSISQAGPQWLGFPAKKVNRFPKIPHLSRKKTFRWKFTIFSHFIRSRKMRFLSDFFSK